MIRFAVIGTNIITREFLDAAAQYPDEIKVTAICSRTMERAKALQADYPDIGLLFDDIAALAACDEVDAVYIGTTNYVHYPQAMAMLQSRKHVLVEKPAGSNYHEVASMVDYANQMGLVWMEAIRDVYMPGYEVIKNNLHKLGDIRRFTAIYCKYSSRYDAFKSGTYLNAFIPDLSNSALMDLGVYCVHPIVKLFGRPLSVNCSGIRMHNGFEGMGTLILNYPDKQGVVMFSKINNSHSPAEIQGELGCMLMPHVTSMDHLTIRYNDGSVEELPMDEHKNGMYYQVGTFIKAVKGEYDLKDAYKASLDEAWVMETARRQTGVRFPADEIY